MKTTDRRIFTVCMALMAFALPSAAQQMPRTSKEQIKGAPEITTQVLRGTVVFVEGNQLVVKMSSGDVRTFDVPSTRRFIVDGKEVTVNELKPGTKLTATVTTTATPVMDRTTTVGSGKVWYVSGNTVILTLPNNENKQYTVKESYRFNVNGQQASVHELRKGMIVSAEKIVEEPRTEIASNTVVTGEAPKPKVETAQAPPPKPTPAPEAAPTPAPAPEPVQQAANPPARLPKTGSSLPLVGLAGLLLTGASLVLRTLRRA